MESAPERVLLVVGYPGTDATARAAVVGLRDNAQLASDISLTVVERIVERSLDAPTTAQAEQLLEPLFADHGDDSVPGLTNTGSLDPLPAGLALRRYDTPSAKRHAGG